MEALPPPPPAAIAYHHEEVPGLSDPITIDASTLPPSTEATSPLDTVTINQAELTPGETRSLPENTESQADTGSSKGRGAKILKGEAGALLLDAGLRAAGFGLPIREIAGTGLDVKTYSTDSPEQVRETKIAKVRKVAGILALNLATGYALQKGVPVLLDVVRDNLEGSSVDTALQLTGKVGLMGGATSLLNRR